MGRKAARTTKRSRQIIADSDEEGPDAEVVVDEVQERGQPSRGPASGQAPSQDELKAGLKAMHSDLQVYRAEAGASEEQLRHLRKKHDLSEGVVAAMVKEVARYALMWQAEHPDVPLKLADITKKAIEPTRGRSANKLPAGLADIIITQAQALLSEQVGVELKELPHADKQPRMFAVKTLLPPFMVGEAQQGEGTWGGGSEAEQGLLLMVLSCIQFNQGKLPENDLLQALSQLNLKVRKPEDGPGARVEHDPLFGNIEELFKRWERQRWIVSQREKVGAVLQGRPDTVKVWRHGERCLDEFGEQGVARLAETTLLA